MMERPLYLASIDDERIITLSTLGKLVPSSENLALIKRRANTLLFLDADDFGFQKKLNDNLSFISATQILR